MRTKSEVADFNISLAERHTKLLIQWARKSENFLEFLAAELMGHGNEDALVEDIINTWDCDKFRDFLQSKFEEYKRVGRGLENISMIFYYFMELNCNLGLKLIRVQWK